MRNPYAIFLAVVTVFVALLMGACAADPLGIRYAADTNAAARVQVAAYNAQAQTAIAQANAQAAVQAAAYNAQASAQTSMVWAAVLPAVLVIVVLGLLAGLALVFGYSLMSGRSVAPRRRAELAPPASWPVYGALPPPPGVRVLPGYGQPAELPAPAVVQVPVGALPPPIRRLQYIE